MEYQVFLLRRYLFQTYGRLHLTKIIDFSIIDRNTAFFTQNLQHLVFLLVFMTLKYPMILEIHLKLFNSLIKKV